MFVDYLMTLPVLQITYRTWPNTGPQGVCGCLEPSVILTERMLVNLFFLNTLNEYRQVCCMQDLYLTAAPPNSRLFMTAERLKFLTRGCDVQ
jgi:hypothetical protein